MPQKTCQVGGGFLLRRESMTPAAIRLDQITRDLASVRALDHLALQVPTGIIASRALGPILAAISGPK
jgi:hypothetical protein